MSTTHICGITIFLKLWFYLEYALFSEIIIVDMKYIVDDHVREIF